MKLNDNLNKKCIIALLVSSFMIPAFSTMAEDDDLQNQLTDVQTQMDAQTQKKNEAEAVIGSVFEKLRVIQQNLDTAMAEYKAVSEQLTQTENQIQKTQSDLDKAQANLSKRQGVLGNRIRDIYMHGQLNYLDVVMGAKDFNDFANRVDLLKRIINSDMDLIDSIMDERDQINKQKEILVVERQKQVQLKSESAKKKEEVEKHKAEQQAIMDKAQNDKATAEAAYAELQASSQQIANMLRARAAARSGGSSSGSGASGGVVDDYQPVKGSGVFIWPVNGVITSPFGYRNHPIFGRTILHSGIDIGVDEGTPVHAADGGVVVEADWIGGYGNAVIIDHGNGLSTLYGHNSSLAVSAGQTVSQGQVIAYAGSTGNSTGPHVHFEVRANGDPVDPNGYL